MPTLWRETPSWSGEGASSKFIDEMKHTALFSFGLALLLATAAVPAVAQSSDSGSNNDRPAETQRPTRPPERPSLRRRPEPQPAPQRRPDNNRGSDREDSGSDRSSFARPAGFLEDLI